MSIGLALSLPLYHLLRVHMLYIHPLIILRSWLHTVVNKLGTAVCVYEVYCMT